jgi:AGCS family alanine or glycine:cation symporter
VLYGFKAFYLVMVVVGCTMQLSAIVDLADGLLFIMAIPNLIGLYLLAPVVKRELAAYMERVRSGTTR